MSTAAVIPRAMSFDVTSAGGWLRHARQRYGMEGRERHGKVFTPD